MSPRRTRRGTVKDNLSNVSMEQSKLEKSPKKNIRRTRRYKNSDDEESHVNESKTNSILDISNSTHEVTKKKVNKKNQKQPPQIEEITKLQNADSEDSSSSRTKKQKTENLRGKKKSILRSEDDSIFKKKIGKNISRSQSLSDNNDDSNSYERKISKSIKKKRQDNYSEKILKETDFSETNLSNDIPVTPKSSPTNKFSLSPHRSTKTPKKSPINLGSPKTHDSSKLLNASRKLKIDSSINELDSNKKHNKKDPEMEKKKKSLSPLKIKRLSSTPKIALKTPKTKHGKNSKKKLNSSLKSLSNVVSPNEAHSIKEKCNTSMNSTMGIEENSINKSRRKNATPIMFTEDSNSPCGKRLSIQLVPVDLSSLKNAIDRPDKHSLSSKKIATTENASQKLVTKISPTKSKFKTQKSKLIDSSDSNKKISTPITLYPRPSSTSTPRVFSNQNVNNFSRSLNSFVNKATLKIKDVMNKSKNSSQKHQKDTESTALIHNESPPITLNESSLLPMDASYDSDSHESHKTREGPKSPDKNSTYEVNEPKTPLFAKAARQTNKRNDNQTEKKKDFKVRFTTPPTNRIRPSVNLNRVGTPANPSRKNSSIVTGMNDSKKITLSPKSSVARFSTINQNASSISSAHTPRNLRRSQSINRSNVKTINPLVRSASVCISSNSVSSQKKTNPAAKSIEKSKIPNFAGIHKKLFDKMESLVDVRNRAKLRHDALNSTAKKRLEMSDRPASNVPASKDTYNRFGFKLRKNDVVNIIAKKDSGPVISSDHKRAENRSVLKGVRMNRRFELQMLARSKK